ncbi:Zn(2)-C6 fungal-type domain-containing protein [Mycena kentingensis (nom. inval.)]|nr:Zn(2)-C6 fungal-type domain-containing protein [Mycena kentingensis (nom. inval.)]
MKPAKFKTPTCVLCRKRKLRCDGGNPCGPCTRTRTPVVCTYVPKTVGQLRSELPKGGACITCRQRKRRCDGNFPCRTCTQAGRPDECKYRDKPPSLGKNKQTASRLHAHDDAHLSSDSASTSSGSASSSRPTTPPLRLQTDFHDFNPELDLQGLDAMFSGQGWGAEEWGMPADCGFGAGLGMELGLGSRSGSESVTTPSSCNDLSLPGLDSLGYVPAPRQPSSEQAIVRTLLLEHCWHYGLNVPVAKLDAIVNGDVSGLLVHPALVDASEMLGYILRYQAHPDGWLSFNTQSAAELELDLRIRDALSGSSGPPPDPLTTLQVYALLATYYMQKEDICGAQEVLAKAGNLLVLHSATLGLHDSSASPASRSPPREWSPQFDASYLSPHTHTEEVRAALAQIVAFDIGAQLVVQLPSSLDPELVERFRRMCTAYQDTTTNFLRGKSYLFLLDARELVAAWWKFPAGAGAPSAWCKRYRALIEEVHVHLNFMNALMLDVSYIPVLGTALCLLRQCLIVSYAALAELHALFASAPAGSCPTAQVDAGAARKLREAVGEIVRLTQEFAPRDFEFGDPVLNVAWSIAARTAQAAEASSLGVGVGAGGFASQVLLFFKDCSMRLRGCGPYTMQL